MKPERYEPSAYVKLLLALTAIVISAYGLHLLKALRGG